MHEGTRWVLLDRPCEDGDRIFFDNGNPITSLAFSSEAPARRNSQLYVPSRVTPNKVLTSLETFFYSEASLLGVVELSPCYSCHAIKGVILKYQDGRQRAVGEIRLDALTTPIRVDPSSPARLRFKLENQRFPYVSEISQESDVEGIRLFSPGLLRWWWSSRQCQVTVGDQRSPPMCSANGGI